MAETEQEIRTCEEELERAKQTLDLEALDRLYADDLVLTGVLGEPPCSKSAILDEAKRGIAERERAKACGTLLVVSSSNEDLRIAVHGNAGIATYRFVVQIKGVDLDVYRPYRTTNVWIKRQDRWQVAAAQTSLVLEPRQLAVLTGESKP